MEIFENHDGRYCLTIEVDDIDEATETLFDELELHGGGHTWRGVVDGLVGLKMKKHADRLTDIWAEADNMNLYSDDKQLLEQVQKLFEQAVKDPKLMKAAIDYCDGEIE